jgi:hypothetical protein
LRVGGDDGDDDKKKDRIEELKMLFEWFVYVFFLYLKLVSFSFEDTQHWRQRVGMWNLQGICQDRHDFYICLMETSKGAKKLFQFER